MSECRDCRISRRKFLKSAGVGVGALAMTDPILNMVAKTFAQSAGGTGNLLVLCQLDGGLDVLSFLAPFTSQVYKSRRPILALTPELVTPLSDHPELGINNQFSFFSELYAQRQLAIVQQVGYPESNGSHFESQDIYEYGVRNLASMSGSNLSWFERLRKTYFDEPFGVLDTNTIGDPRYYGYPDQTYRKASQEAFGRLARLQRERTTMQQSIADAYARIDTRGQEIREKTEAFESTGEARGEFFRAAQLASAKLGTQILKLRYGGFDTHGDQLSANEDLFPRLNNEFQQFVNDLQSMGLWERTCVCFYTEFGRRNEENGSPGTDHGYGGHMILAGPAVNGGLHGQKVGTNDLNQDSLPYYVDFRAVFGSCIEDWLGFDPKPIFELDGENYDTQIGSSLFS